MACAIMPPVVGIAADAAASQRFAPPQQEGIADAFAELEACSELSPELARPYADWIARNQLQAMMAEMRADERYTAYKRAFLEHLKSTGPRAEVVAACRQELEFPKRAR